MYMVHLQDYDLDTVSDHPRAQGPDRPGPGRGTIKPAAMHNGEGSPLFPYDHHPGSDGADHSPATSKFGTGCHTWSGNYKAGIWNATPWSGAGLAVHTARIRSIITLDPNAHGKEIKTKSYYYGEEVAYWNHGDTALIVNTPKYGRKVFTGKTHAEPQQSPLGHERERP